MIFKNSNWKMAKKKLFQTCQSLFRLAKQSQSLDVQDLERHLSSHVLPPPYQSTQVTSVLKELLFKKTSDLQEGLSVMYLLFFIAALMCDLMSFSSCLPLKQGSAASQCEPRSRKAWRWQALPTQELLWTVSQMEKLRGL